MTLLLLTNCVLLTLAPARGGWEIFSTTNFLEWTCRTNSHPGPTQFAFPVRAAAEFFRAEPACNYPTEGHELLYWAHTATHSYDRTDRDLTERWQRGSHTVTDGGDAASAGFACLRFYGNEEECGFTLTYAPGEPRTLEQYGDCNYQPGPVLPGADWADVDDYRTYSTNFYVRRDHFTRTASATVRLHLGGDAGQCRLFRWRIGAFGWQLTRVTDEVDLVRPFATVPATKLNGAAPARSGDGLNFFDITAPEHGVIDLTPDFPAGTWVAVDFTIDRLDP